MERFKLDRELDIHFASALKALENKSIEAGLSEDVVNEKIRLRYAYFRRLIERSVTTIVRNSFILILSFIFGLYLACFSDEVTLMLLGGVLSSISGYLFKLQIIRYLAIKKQQLDLDAFADKRKDRLTVLTPSP